jgi:hypothetical protein
LRVVRALRRGAQEDEMKRLSGALVVLVGLTGGCSLASETDSTDPSSQSASSNGLSRGRPGLQVAPDPAGTMASFSTNDFDAGPSDAFFASLGTNGRTCNSCHKQDQGWTVSAAKVRELAANDPSDPLFAPVDGSDCPPTRSAQSADAAASTLLTGYGLIRLQIAPKSSADFAVTATNPQGCTIPPTDPSIGGALFLFRRPLPSANLAVLSTVMWDGRETREKLTQAQGFTGTGPLVFDLSRQDDDANLGHAQALGSILGTSTDDDLLGFETNLYTAQLTVGGLDLGASGAHGGPRYIGDVVVPRFFIGENDPLVPGFTTEVFKVFEAWEPNANGDFRAGLSDAQKAIGRGEQVFNHRTFTITNVAGLNSASGDPLANPADPLFDTPFTGACTTCHNAFDVGNHSTSLPINIGITMAHPTDDLGAPIDGILDVGHLPVYTLRSASSKTVQVTDPARALITGRFVDAGKTKGPVLRALSSRAPYFHNGSAPDLATVVRFYQARFNIGLTPDEMSDLAAFLAAL